MQKATATSKSHISCVKVAGGTQPECNSSTVPIIPGITGPVIVKVPVTLSEISLQVNLDSIITLPEAALEIKYIKKNLKVTQCLLLLAPGGVTTNVPLFIKGFVRKNIDYATLGCSTTDGVCGDIRHCTVDVPFNCTTIVYFNGALPVLPQPNSSNEFGYHRKQKIKGTGFAEKDHLLSSDLSEFNQVTEEFFTELPYCELIQARMVEYDEYLNRQRPKGVILPFEEREFRQVEEKMVLNIQLKIIQSQQVSIPAPAPPPCVPFAEADGGGQFTFQHFLGNQSGCVSIAGSTIGSVRLTITQNGVVLADFDNTGVTAFVTIFEYDPNTDPQTLTVNIDAGEGSVWSLTISCPGPCLDAVGPAVKPLVAEEFQKKIGSKTINIAKVTSTVK